MHPSRRNSVKAVISPPSKCDCRGKDKKKKDIYATHQSALDAAKYIEESRGIFLKIYKCPQNNGWHLTSNDALSGITSRTEETLQDNDIPLKASDGSWEYVNEDESNDTYVGDYFKGKPIKQSKKFDHAKPIIKIECENESQTKTIFGKITEIITNIDIEKAFKINMQNPICANMIKNVLDGKICQITIFADNRGKNQTESYTILIKNDLLKKRNIKKGNLININISGKTINNINKWIGNNLWT